MSLSKSKAAASLKGIFDEAKVRAAEAVMQPSPQPMPAVVRNRKTGGRGVRISGYLPAEIEESLRDEVISRTMASRRSVSFNDVLCSILADWTERRKEASK